MRPWHSNEDVLTRTCSWSNRFLVVILRFPCGCSKIRFLYLTQRSCFGTSSDANLANASRDGYLTGATWYTSKFSVREKAFIHQSLARYHLSRNHTHHFKHLRSLNFLWPSRARSWHHEDWMTRLICACSLGRICSSTVQSVVSQDRNPFDLAIMSSPCFASYT